LEAGRRLLSNWYEGSPVEGVQRIKQLFLLGLGAASVDFNNPRFQTALTAQSGPGEWLLQFIHESIAKDFSPALGGDYFLHDFIDRYAQRRELATFSFLPGNCAQAYVSMAICQELLRNNPYLKILFVPKSGAPGNDLNLETAQGALRAESESLLKGLAQFEREARFTFISEGPSIHGLDPRHLSAKFAEALVKSDVIIAEGQAYAEICGWKKPTYIAFRVNGRVAEAIHGVSHLTGPCAFVRLTPGVDHFEDFETAVLRNVTDHATSGKIPA